MKIEIKHRHTGAVLFAHEAEGNTLRLTVEAAVKASISIASADLADANLADANLAGADLAGADLASANLAGAYLAGAYLADAYLAGAYLAGAYLADAYLAGANLAGAYLADAYLAGAYLAGAYLADAYLAGANLAGANLAGAYLAGANLAGANLAGAYLAGANVPIIPHIDAAILRAIETPGNSLDMSDWHSCETTHCRAGWAIALAGEAGRRLEAAIGPNAAGALIYAASRPTKRVPDFTDFDENVLADLRACAAADPLPAEAI